ncbi:uroporphyrinogen decarboxylase [Microbacterium elymi]|uniref:Uroporphyrinogen decarboxylase n=1 Tax=Microbacterium elymi TaxID=2909587 RepID=A0ABY5NMD2_9MICO|nr:uroporphyrinogen decarboxylase [Microbacterium elymi]UUT36293.1 uroporphyrinogen decarboxylase [Microbacterium elymi]
MTTVPTAPRPLPADHPLTVGATASAPLVQAYRGVRPQTAPVWFMRQAGRSLPEYRALRAGGGMLERCLDPETAAEITLQPVRRHGVDAAIFFSDIVIPLRLAGIGVEIQSGVGPVFDRAVRTAADVDALVATGPLTADDDALEPIRAGVRRTVDALGTTPLIGFAGAPFTLAAYLVEGRPSRDHLAARRLMHVDPDAWARLMAWCADVTGAFLRAQLLAGASAGQLFDSWAGSLSRADYAQHVAPASARALGWARGLTADGAAVPLVHFGLGTGEFLPEMRDAGADVVGVDYRMPLDEASRRLGDAVPLQGNIDPALLAAPWPVLEEHARDVLRRGRAAPAHVVNLGHGVPPDTDPDVLTRLVRLVHDAGADAALRSHDAGADADAARRSDAAGPTGAEAVAG